jgi:hypothetical protein
MYNISPYRENIQRYAQIKQHIFVNFVLCNNNIYEKIIHLRIIIENKLVEKSPDNWNPETNVACVKYCKSIL